MVRIFLKSGFRNTSAARQMSLQKLPTPGNPPVVSFYKNVAWTAMFLSKSFLKKYVAPQLQLHTKKQGRSSKD